MQKIILSILITLAAVTFASGQKAVYDRKNVMTAIYNIGVDSGLDIDSCSVEKINGRVLSVSEEYPDASAIILTSKGRQSVSINTESMSMADRSNFFYSLLKKGKRVQIGAYMCGSGGFMYATSVKVNAVQTKRGK